MEKINDKIRERVEDIKKDFEKHDNRNANLSYDVTKFDEKILSILLTYTNWQKNGASFEKMQGMTFDLKNGEEIELKHYFSSQEVQKRAKNGLSYIYGVTTSKRLDEPDSYYIAEDDNVIVIYDPGTIIASAKESYDIDISAVDFDAPFKPKPAKSSKSKISSSEKIYSGNNSGFVINRFSGVVTGDSVRARSQASLNSRVVGYFTKGEKVEVRAVEIGQKYNWYKVKRKNDKESCWIATDFCKIENAKRVQIAGTWVRMRDNAGLNSHITGYFEANERVQVLTSKEVDNHTWNLVLRKNGDIYWVSKNYCK